MSCWHLFRLLKLGSAIPLPSGLINLTTVLAHSSGEWIASDWPGMPSQRNRLTASNGSGADVCAPIRPVRSRRHYRRRRSGCARFAEPVVFKLLCRHLLHFVDQFAQMDRLRQHLGVFGRVRIGIERDCGKAGDEHDLDVGSSSAAWRASLIPSISGITISVSSSSNGSSRSRW